MRYIALDFVFRMQGEGHFPPYPGSMLRGVLGRSLRQAVCMIRGRDCADCMLSGTCAFPRLFSAASAPQSAHAPLMAPPPFCIEPEQNAPCELAPGDSFSFRLKLFSHAVDYLPYFIHAFKIAGERGLGSGISAGHGRMALEDVRQKGSSIYLASEERLLDWQAEDLAMPGLLPIDADSGLGIRLLSPLRFKQANHLACALDFRQFLSLVLRRMASLEALENRTFRLPAHEFAALREAAAAIKVTESHLRWHDWRRYSSRQGTPMQLGGLVGKISCRGPVRAFGQYLDFAAKVHLGKQTSFGLGALDFQWMPVPATPGAGV